MFHVSNVLSFYTIILDAFKDQKDTADGITFRIVVMKYLLLILDVNQHSINKLAWLNIQNQTAYKLFVKFQYIHLRLI